MSGSPKIDSISLRLSMVIETLKIALRYDRSSKDRPMSELEEDQKELKTRTVRELAEVLSLLDKVNTMLEKAGRATPES